MATIVDYILDGQTLEPFREAQNLSIAANFGTEIQPSIGIDSVPFVDTKGKLNSSLVRTKWQNNPVEGAPFALIIQGDNNSGNSVSYNFDFYLDYTRMQFLSAVETEVGLKKNRSLDQFDFRAQGITQELLRLKGFITPSDIQKVPYVVKNRNTQLERLQIVGQGFVIFKSIIDELHKILNLASDIPTLGVAPALVNLTISITNLTLLFNQLVDWIELAINTFFPPVKYHGGIKPKTFIDKAADYIGLAGVEYGTLTPIMEQLTWLGSKNHEKGVITFVGNMFNGVLDGIMNPNDTGYVLADCVDVLTQQFRLRRAIINNVLHLRPENDPFWTQQSGYVMPDVLVEQTFAQNGTWRPNYEDLNSATIIQYATDDSDKWTLDDLLDEQDPTSTGKIINVTTVSALNTVNEANNLLTGLKEVNIPFAIGVRNTPIQDLLGPLSDNLNIFGDNLAILQQYISAYSSDLNGANPIISGILSQIITRVGALKVENDYFSTPKQMLITTNQIGEPTLVDGQEDLIGAKALYNNYHTWDSFIPGQRNPNEPGQTAAKYVYENVRIPFGIADFTEILNIGYFTTESGKIGKFISVDWNVEGDFATVSYWVYENWMSNIEENQV